MIYDKVVTRYMKRVIPNNVQPHHKPGGSIWVESKKVFFIPIPIYKSGPVFGKTKFVYEKMRDKHPHKYPAIKVIIKLKRYAIQEAMQKARPPSEFGKFSFINCHPVVLQEVIAQKM